MTAALPGAPGGTVPPGQNLTVPELQAHLDTNQARADQLAANLYNAVEGVINNHIRQRSEMANRIEGGINSTLAASNDRAGKVAGKISKRINNALGQNYTYAFPLGITYPTNDQVVHGLQTGDMVGALGATPIPVDQIPGPTLVGGGGNDQPGPLPFVPPPAPPVLQPPPGQTFPPPPPPTFPPPPPPPTFPPPTAQPPATLPGGSGGQGPPPTNPPPRPQPAGGGGKPGGPPQPPPVIPPPPAMPPGGPAPNPCPPGMVPGPGTGNYPTPPATIPPAIVFGWAPPGQPPVIGTSGGVPTVQPWGPGPSGPPGTDTVLVCVDGSHLSPPGAGQVHWFIPGGFLLWVDTVNGHVTAAATMPGANYTLVPLVPCDPNAPDPIYNPGGGTGGPACVPGPPTCDPGAGGGGGGGGNGPPVQPPPQPCAGPPLNNPLPPVQPLGVPPAPGDLCDMLQGYLDSIRRQELTVASFIGMAAGALDGSWVAKAITYALTGQNLPIIPTIVNSVAGWMQKVILNVATGIACDPAAATPVLVLRGAMEFLEKWFGIIPEQVRGVIDQASHFVCQWKLPTAHNANAAWLANTADDKTWECWVKAAGEILGSWQQIRDAERTRPSPADARRLYFRNLIDQPTYTKLNRQHGIINKDEQDWIEQSARPWPAGHEVMRWAGEGLFDDATIQRFHLDEGFGDLYNTQFKKYWEASGADATYATYAWEAHWRRPGIGELFEMSQRLRPTRVDPSLVFTKDDLAAALKQEGFNTYWGSRITFLAAKKPTRRDVQRLYDYHQVDEDEMGELLQDMGYDSDFAAQLVGTWKTDRVVKEARYNGNPMGGAIVRDYANGVLALGEMKVAAQAISYYQGQSDQIVGNAVNARVMAERRLALSGLKAEFTRGLISIASVQGQLAGLGMDADAIQEITQFWSRLKQSRPKQVPAATLCTWRTDGLIDSTQQFNALLELGYNRETATYIVSDCTLKIQQANHKAEQKALAAAQKAAEAAAKSAEKAAVNAKRRVKIVTAPSGNGTGH